MWSDSDLPEAALRLLLSKESSEAAGGSASNKNKNNNSSILDMIIPAAESHAEAEACPRLLLSPRSFWAKSFRGEGAALAATGTLRALDLCGLSSTVVQKKTSRIFSTTETTTTLPYNSYSGFSVPAGREPPSLPRGGIGARSTRIFAHREGDAAAADSDEDANLSNSDIELSAEEASAVVPTLDAGGGRQEVHGRNCLYLKPRVYPSPVAGDSRDYIEENTEVRVGTPWRRDPGTEKWAVHAGGTQSASSAFPGSDVDRLLLSDYERLPTDALGRKLSFGSLLHGSREGKCRVCAFSTHSSLTRGRVCKNGALCDFCHVGHKRFIHRRPL